MEAVKPLASKRARDRSALCDDVSSSRECTVKGMATGLASPSRDVRPCNPAPQQKDAGDAVLDVEELLLKALEDELEPQEKNASEAAGASGIAASLASSSWLPNVEEDDNYDESDDED